MDIKNVSLEDGRQCAHLIKALGAARFADLSGSDLEAVVAAKQWLRALAGKMADELKLSQKPVSPTESKKEPEQGFKIKGMGPIGSTPKSKKKK